MEYGFKVAPPVFARRAFLLSLSKEIRLSSLQEVEL